MPDAHKQRASMQLSTTATSPIQPTKPQEN